MPKVTILVEGYADFSKDEWVDESTVTLVENSSKKIIVDPGVDREALLTALKKKNLTLVDITHVFLTHKHLDHTLLAGIFPCATTSTGRTWYNGVCEGHHDEDYFGDGVKIVSTPGQTVDHRSLLIETNRGKILLAGDLFWWDRNEIQKTDFESLLNREDQFAEDKNALMESRKKMLACVDWIVPGHGKMFKSPLSKNP